MNGKYKVPDLSGIGQEPAEETLAHCEIVRIDQYRPYMKPVAGFSSSGNGDLRTIEMAARKAMEFVRYATGLRREEARLSQLTIGLKCGESDTTSGFASNPAVGVVTERLTSSGADAIMECMARVCSGEYTSTEMLFHEEFAPTRLFPQS